MLIRVTQDHIDRGRYLSSMACPVALAMTEQTGLSCHVGISQMWAAYGGGRYTPMFPLPPAVVEFVEKFDSHERVSPIEFEPPAGMV